MSSDPRATKNRPRRHPDFASFSRIGALVSSIQKGGADPEFSFAPKVFRLLLFLSCLQTSNMISPLERLLGPGRIATDDGQLLCTLNIQTVPDNSPAFFFGDVKLSLEGKKEKKTLFEKGL